jgi:hypothetical protein
MIAGTSDQAVRSLIEVFRGNLRQFVTFLFVTYANLGEETFRRIFVGSQPDMPLIQRMVEHLAALDPMPPPAFEEMRTVFADALR